ncbi:hypothetical protein RJ639_030433 [Escallonia herrerae]|uniref:PWWP domain-containing protein n=1 Tax=Escallonia herrerae TaxID=1293975 RepID=A0AA88X0H5_9ASTE|nr:hypothetical protein RJ639_030433 [Escallonia herrerae]
MGIPEEECKIGRVVWVQRNNGSWWPGRIMGRRELFSWDRISTKTHTPVKLLGPGKPTVDWYNLEKSEQIKTFRCGEFDDCIERAESSGVYRSRKHVKYACREDAIRHALNLEKEEQRKIHKHQGKKQQVGEVCRAKRSIHVYLPADKHSCSEHTVLHPERPPNFPLTTSDDFSNSDCQKREGAKAATHSSDAKDIGDKKWKVKGKRELLNLNQQPVIFTDGPFLRSGNGAQKGEEKIRMKSTHNLLGVVTDGPSLRSKNEMHHTADDDVDEKRKGKGERKRKTHILDQKTAVVTEEPYPRSCNGARKEKEKIKFQYVHKLLEVVTDRPKVRKNEIHSTGDLLTASAASDLTLVDSKPWENLFRKVNTLGGGYFEDTGGHWFSSVHKRHQKRKEAILVDVGLTVQVTHQGEHVPLVSLMSRLNGKGIIGHPMEIEALEDGASESHFYKEDDVGHRWFDEVEINMFQAGLRAPKSSPLSNARHHSTSKDNKPLQACQKSGNSSLKVWIRKPLCKPRCLNKKLENSHLSPKRSLAWMGLAKRGVS